MSRGKAAEEGATYWSQNGYHYTKKDNKFQLTHKLMMEEHLGRKLGDHERVRFIDGNRKNLTIENLKVVIKGKASLNTQRARLVARRDELNAQIAEIDKALELNADKDRIRTLETERAELESKVV